MRIKYIFTKIILPIAALLMIVFLIVSNYKYINNSKSTPTENILPEKKSTNITISFAGDVTLGNYINSSYFGTFDHEMENQNHDYSYVFKNVSQIFEDDDITIVNLEGPLTDSSYGDKEKTFAFRGEPDYVNILKEGSVEAVSLANNHSLDYFEKGLSDTRSILEDNNIQYAGLGHNAIIKVDGINIGLLAYNGWPSNYNDSFLDSIKNDISSLKKDASMIIVYFHWGIERDYYPSKVQKDFARFCVDNGADLIIGSHPHVIQGIEEYNGVNIVYSLGNFAFGGNKNPPDKDSMIYQQTFTFENNTLLNSSEPNIIPCSISSSSNRNNYQPTPLNGEEAKRVLDKIKEVSNFN